mgnify:CR=1 FL=1
MRLATRLALSPKTVEAYGRDLRQFLVEASTDNQTWSGWTSVPASGGAITSPAGRFLQYRATLTSSATASPRLDEVSYTVIDIPAEPAIIAWALGESSHPATMTKSPSVASMVSRMDANWAASIPSFSASAQTLLCLID